MTRHNTKIAIGITSGLVFLSIFWIGEYVGVVYKDSWMLDPMMGTLMMVWLGSLALSTYCFASIIIERKENGKA